MPYAITTAGSVVLIALALCSGGATAGGLFGEGGLIRGDVGNFLDRNVEKPVTTPLARAAETAVGEIGETAVEVTIAINPVPAMVADLLVDGDSPEEALNEQLSGGKEALQRLADLPTIANDLQNAQLTVIANVAGEDAASVMGLLTLDRQIANQLPAVIVDKLIDVSEGEDAAVEDLVGIPLNAAILQAKAVYEPIAKPLPEAVVVLLGMGNVFTPEHLASVRYAVDDGAGNIAGLINLLQKTMGSGKGGNHAVTVDNIIVFAKEPGVRDDLFFWSHEVQHTVQYKLLGVDGFAAAYARDHKNLESDADDAAGRVVAAVSAVLTALLAPQ